MRLTHITIENFKGIRDRVEIPLRPITLLFGGNSAGKSTILQALFYLKEILQNRNLDADVVSGGGGSINLGGFKHMVHGHDLSRSIVIGARVLLDDDGLGLEVRDPEGTLKDPTEFTERMNQATEIGVEFGCGWDIGTMAPRLNNIRVIVDGSPCQEIRTGEIGTTELKLFPQHAVFMGLLDSGSSGFVVPIGEIGNKVLTEEETAAALERIKSEGDQEDEELAFLVALMSSTTELRKQSEWIVLRELNTLRYIGPIREFPERGASAQRTPDANRWASGLAAWDWLGKNDDAMEHQMLLEEMNRCISSTEHLNLDYSLQVPSVREIEDESELHQALMLLMEAAEPEEAAAAVQSALRAAYAELPARKRILLRDLRNGAEVTPQDIGNGVTQVIPVLAGVLAPGGKTLAVEQPELHLHPAIQCRLADIFIRALHSGRERLFLLETHSEHLMLRLMRRVREAYEDESPEPELSLTPDEVSVIYVEAMPEGIKLTPLPLTADGDFSENWPSGFFEDRAAELF